MEEPRIRSSRSGISGKSDRGENGSSFRRQLSERDPGFPDWRSNCIEFTLAGRAALSEKTRLIIVPDGCLWEMPFPGSHNVPESVFERISGDLFRSLTDGAEQHNRASK
ncbi:MAG: hypothetical protein IPM55_22990 [Acidobacteria bacterium]|nr:hypothetical protein [Acidobacteriota bacterium]